MSLRNTEIYKRLDAFKACGIVEGFTGPENEETQLIAWQWIADTGLWRSLQGFYGRAVHDLLNSGMIEPKIS